MMISGYLTDLGMKTLGHVPVKLEVLKDLP
jgi:hypothetical protein